MLLLLVCNNGVNLAAETTATRKKPNVIILFADDMRAKTINALGNKEVKTPNLDQIVHDGVAFPHAYIKGPMAALSAFQVARCS